MLALSGVNVALGMLARVGAASVLEQIPYEQGEQGEEQCNRKYYRGCKQSYVGVVRCGGLFIVPGVVIRIAARHCHLCRRIVYEHAGSIGGVISVTEVNERLLVALGVVIVPGLTVLRRILVEGDIARVVVEGVGVVHRVVAGGAVALAQLVFGNEAVEQFFEVCDVLIRARQHVLFGDQPAFVEQADVGVDYVALIRAGYVAERFLADGNCAVIEHHKAAGHAAVFGVCGKRTAAVRDHAAVISLTAPEFEYEFLALVAGVNKEGNGLPGVCHSVAVCVVSEVFDNCRLGRCSAAEQVAVCVVPAVNHCHQLPCAVGVVVSERNAVLAADLEVGYGLLGIGNFGVAFVVGRRDDVAVFAVLIPEHLGSGAVGVLRRKVVGGLFAVVVAVCVGLCGLFGAYIVYRVFVKVGKVRGFACACRVIGSPFVVILSAVVIHVGKQVAVLVLVESVAAQAVNDVQALVVIGVVLRFSVEHVAFAVVPEAVFGKVKRRYLGAAVGIGEIYIGCCARAHFHPYGHCLVRGGGNGSGAACDKAVVHCGRFAYRPHGVHYEQRLHARLAEHLVPYFGSVGRLYQRKVSAHALEQRFKPCKPLAVLLGGGYIVAEVVLVYKAGILVGVALVVAVGINGIFINDRSARAVCSVIGGGAGDVALDVVAERAVNIVEVVVCAVVHGLEREALCVRAGRGKVEYVLVVDVCRLDICYRGIAGRVVGYGGIHYRALPEAEIDGERLLFVEGIFNEEEALHPTVVDILFVAEVERLAGRVYGKAGERFSVRRVVERYGGRRCAVHVGRLYPEGYYLVAVRFNGKAAAADLRGVGGALCRKYHQRGGVL